jgi:hypothetical protein
MVLIYSFEIFPKHVFYWLPIYSAKKLQFSYLLENNNKIDIVEMNAIGAEEFKKLVWDTN